MKVFDIFCGTKSIANKANELGHETFTLDFDAQHNPDIVANILPWSPELAWFTPDMIWASPPCTTFSVASIGHHWNEDNTPKTKEAEIGIKIIEKTKAIIKYFQNRNPDLIYYIENPCGKLRSLDLMKEFFLYEVTYCQYGDNNRKPTDIWSNNLIWNPKPKCKPNDEYYTAPCHVAAPRGSRKGVQGVEGKIDRSRVPELLCEEVINKAAELLYMKRNNIKIVRAGQGLLFE